MLQLKRGYYKGLYLTAAIYDLFLGSVFLLFYRPLMEALNLPIPSNPAYLSASAMFILIYGILLFMIYWKPEGSRRMVFYAIFFKVGYIGVTAYYLITRGTDFVEWPFMAFAGCDLIFALLFAESLRFIKE